MKDENEPTFTDPLTGVVPLGVNNVDVVVNANVAYALASTEKKHVPGYSECLHLLARAVHEHAWPEAGLYYPQKMMFPYAVSRAYRAGANEGPMPLAMKQLMRQLLDLQEQRGHLCLKRCRYRPKGSFPGGQDASFHLSTALGLAALLNLGRPLACEIGEAERFDRAVDEAAKFIIQSRRKHHIYHSSTQWAMGPTIQTAAIWDTGLFFGGPSDIATWRSHAITVAVTLEALGKYAIGYDRNPGLDSNLSLQILPVSCRGHYFRLTSP